MDKHPTLFITHRGERHQQAALEAAPVELDVIMRRTPSRAEILALLPNVEFLITERTGEIGAELIQVGKNLRLIQRLGAQTHDIDLAAAQAAGIPVCYQPVRSCIMVAEHLLMQMLGLAKRLREASEVTLAAGDWGQPRRCDEDYFAYNWSGRGGVQGLWGATVGILGMGEIGAELARRLRGFGCTVLYNKRHPLPAEAERELNVQFAAVDEMLAASDFVCMLLPFFPETARSLDGAFFAKMKPGSLFVSCGGSGVVDETALTAALRTGHLAGAALDTFTFEPIASDNPILPWARQPHSNVLLTPHTAAGASSARSDTRRDDYDNLVRLLKGEALIGRLV